MVQYFLGITPPEPLKTSLEALRARFGHPHHAVESHITLKAPFAWEQDPDPVLEKVVGACRTVTPFPVQLGAPARFPDAGVLYLSVASAALPGLHRALVAGLAPLVPSDPRNHEGAAYTPHLTLAVARFGIDAEGMERMAAAAVAERVGSDLFVVKSVRCYRRLARDTRWEPFCDLPLDGGGPMVCYNGRG